jgi:hypothetical protein
MLYVLIFIILWFIVGAIASFLVIRMSRKAFNCHHLTEKHYQQTKLIALIAIVNGPLNLLVAIAAFGKDLWRYNPGA